MKILNAFRDGARRVTAAPAVLLGVLLLTFLVALPVGLVLQGMIQSSLGESAAADSAASGVNYEWWQEFSAQATGAGTAFVPRMLGFGGVLANVSGMLDNLPQPAVVSGMGAAYVLLWLFLVGGILDRYARQRAVRASHFFAVSGVFFFRFLRLGLFALAGYALIFGVLHGWMFEAFYPWATHDLVVERTAFLLRLVLYLVFGLVLASFNLWMDYAKIRAVVEDRRSMVGALMAAFRFIRRQPADTFGLYLLDGLAFVVLLALYALVAPGAGGTGWSLWAGLLVTQAYLLLRLWVKLLFYASQVSLFQASLAHAGYTAAPMATWPESPVVEALPHAPQPEK